MVRTYIPKGNKNKWTEEQMQLAIESVNSGKAIASTAKKFGIPRSTLQRKIQCINSPDYEEKVPGFRKAFSDEEEDLLAKYLKALEDKLFVFTRTDVRRLAFQFAERYQPNHRFNKKEGLAGQDWMTNFIKRHPQLSIKKAERISGSDPLELNEEAVLEFFSVLNSVMKQYEFPASRIYNADEMSIIIVPDEMPKITPATKNKRLTDVIPPDEAGDTVTIKVCFSASGEYMPMMIVFPRMTIDDTYLQGTPEGTWAECHPNGCIQSEIFYRWLMKFIEFSGSTKENPVLLILNAHVGYIKCFDVTDLAEENGVIIVCVSAFIKHEIQPIDMSFSKSFSNNYIAEVRQWLQLNSPKTVTIDRIAELLGNAFTKTATLEDAVNGFSKSGIYPFNTEIHPFNSHFMAEELDSTTSEVLGEVQNNEQELTCSASKEFIVNIKKEMSLNENSETNRNPSEKSQKRNNSVQRKNIPQSSAEPIRPKRSITKVQKEFPQQNQPWKKRKLPERTRKTKNSVESDEDAFEANFIDNTDAESIPDKQSSPGQSLSVKLKKQSGKTSNSKSSEEYDLTDGQLYLLKNNKLIPVTLDVVLKAVK
ncbi:uncharacterized protein LOC106639776 [Copidosoma floridanum]|uniref:uncharacterized protein LOC106639776 n=1 Tax=Copidosoma floridanum TaxID=29053 RepID=UPI0006C9B789|nr:uncharacterized protein LOC106639776 [Copidosoma floridanum]